MAEGSAGTATKKKTTRGKTTGIVMSTKIRKGK
jgi:hypothetical protein